MAEGNRKDPRARVLNMTVRYKSATVDEFIENHSHDISRGGIFIKTRSPFPAGTLLKFEVRIAEDQKLMHGVGRVVWRRDPERAEESFPAGMGIKFIKTGEGATELINQLVAARNGAESSFDVGVRESGAMISGAVNSGAVAPGAMNSEALNSGAVAPEAVNSDAPPGVVSRMPAGLASGEPLQVPIIEAPSSESSPALQVESTPRSGPPEGERQVANLPKKRRDQVPETRKVVLQGSALEAPPESEPAPAAAALEKAHASSRELSPAPRNTTFDETTARRPRPAEVPEKSTSPSVFGLLLILALLGIGVFVIRNREQPVGPAGVAPEPAVPAARAPAAAQTEPPVTAQAAEDEAEAASEAADDPEPGEPGAGADPEETSPEAVAGSASAVAGATAPAGAAAAASSSAAKPAAAPAAPKPPARAVKAPAKAPLPVVPKPRPVAPVPKAAAPAKPTAPSAPPEAARSAPAPTPPSEPKQPSAPAPTPPKDTAGANGEPRETEKKPSESAPEQKKPTAPAAEAAPKPAPQPTPPAPAVPGPEDNPY